MFLWEEHEFKKDANKGVGCVQLCVGDSPTRADGCFPPVSVDWFLALCACIGTCSAIGYGAFMLLVPFLHDGCNSSFRNGFAFSGRAVPTSFDSCAAWNECGLNAVVSPRRGQPPVLASHGVQQCTQDVHFFQPLLGLRWRDSHCGHCCWCVHPHTVRAPRVARWSATVVARHDGLLRAGRLWLRL